jgi:SlyX protein
MQYMLASECPQANAAPGRRGDNSAMTAQTDALTPADTDRRLTELEIKASFSEDLIDHLNQAIVRQQQQIDLLMRELRHLRDQLPGDSSGAVRSLRDELPPHY